MTDDRIGNWMLTHSGRKFYPYDPRPEDFDWMDIVVGLRDPRFASQTSSLYTVAQHSVMVSLLVPQRYAWRALLHDSPEALLKDMPRPIKKGLRGYDKLEYAMWSCICTKWDLPIEDPKADRAIKKADRIALVTERAAVQEAAWARSGQVPWREDDMGAKPLPIHVTALAPNAAAELFHQRMIEIRHNRLGLVPSIQNNPWPWYEYTGTDRDLWFEERP